MIKFKDEKVWVTSDWHFFHDKDFCYAARGYSSVKQMTAMLINKFNSVVKPDDTVFCLGDCVMGSIDEEKIISTLEKLNGHIYIILGNHDSDKKVEIYKKCKNITVLGYGEMIQWGKKNIFYLSHYPTLTANYDDEQPFKPTVVNLCGHCHTKNKFDDLDKGLIYHVEVDAHNGYPVSLETIVNDLFKMKIALADKMVFEKS